MSSWLEQQMKQCKSLVVASGGAFKLELFLPEDYPMAAPKVRECSLLRCITDQGSAGCAPHSLILEAIWLTFNCHFEA